MIEELLILLGVLVGLLIIWTILIPMYVMTESFLEKRIKITKTSKKIAKKLKAKTKLQTLKNVYKYVNENYYGEGHQFDYNSLPEAFDYNIAEKLILNKKRFLWCTNQAEIIMSLLINTGQFTKEEIGLKKTLGRQLAAHFYPTVKIGKRTYRVDPFYNIFEPEEKFNLFHLGIPNISPFLKKI